MEKLMKNELQWLKLANPVIAKEFSKQILANMPIGEFSLGERERVLKECIQPLKTKRNSTRIVYKLSNEIPII